jgi:hypothetical protein
MINLYKSHSLEIYPVNKYVNSNKISKESSIFCNFQKNMLYYRQENSFYGENFGEKKFYRQWEEKQFLWL